MAQLSTEDRQRISRGLQRYWSNLWEGTTVSKAELLTTINETDTWIDDNQGNYNSALTYAADFTTLQKIVIFCVVAAMRVSPAFCRALLGNLEG